MAEKRLSGDNQEALRFLRWLRRDGPWVVTAIGLDRRGLDTRTFDPSTIEDLIKWLDAHNGVDNCYVMVNPSRAPLTKKATKEDVEALEFLHVDCDPPKGADLKASRAEILTRLQSYEPKPNAIIDSGGGYQAFWRLAEPVFVGGNVAMAEEVEAYNIQLELVLKGDHCHNIDRIMRLPGTINLPDAKKKAAGRVERLASIIDDLDDNNYTLDTFTAAPRSAPSPAAALSTPRVQISGNLAPVLIDDLPETVPGRIKMLIVQGSDPDEPTKYASRSEVSWAVTCGLLRGGCDDNTVASILLDPDYAASAHTLAQRRPQEYVERQIQRAKEEVEEPMLRLLNEKHAVIHDMGGKCRIISETMDYSVKPPRPKISKQSFEDFRNRYMNQRVAVGKNDKGEAIYMSAGKWWLLHPLRREYTTLVFAPDREIEGAYNLWKGFACEAIPGSNHEPFLNHLRDVVCSGNEEHYDYLIKWMARGVQAPNVQGEVAFVMRGNRGAGKGTVATIYGSLWGRHFLHLSSAKHLVGQFNAHLRDCVFLFADEAFFAGDRAHESSLKTIITEDTQMIEPKGVDAELVPNYLHLMMSSNQDWVVPAGFDERRFFVLDVNEEHKQDTKYFGEIKRAIDNGGRESLLHYLLTLDISDFNVREVPQTGALQAQKIYSMSLEEAWWMERLTDGRTTTHLAGWDEALLKSDLYADYIRFAETQRVQRRATPASLGMFLKKVLPNPFPIGVQRITDVSRVDSFGNESVTRERRYFYDLPNLDDSRVEWEKRFGKCDWPKDETGNELPPPRTQHPDEEPY